jgi:hypothetical protein
LTDAIFASTSEVETSIFRMDEAAKLKIMTSRSPSMA